MTIGFWVWTVIAIWFLCAVQLDVKYEIDQSLLVADFICMVIAAATATIIYQINNR